MVAGTALVNPSVADVVAALGAGWGPEQSGTSPSPSGRSVLKGVMWSLGLAVGWVVLAGTNPGTTYHLAPALVVLVWPLLAPDPSRGGRHRLLAAAGGLLIAIVATSMLALRGALEGPSLVGGSAVHESLAVAAAAVVVVVAWFGRPRGRT